MNKYFLLLLPLLFILTISCNRSISPDSYPREQIVFGSGGGFAGIEHIYYLQDKGDMYYQSGVENSIKKIGKFKKNEIKHLFEKIENLGLKNKSFNHPGNMYYFIAFGNDPSKQRIVWGSHEKTVPEEIKNIYEELNQLVQKIN